MSFTRWCCFITARGSDCSYLWAVLSLERGLTIFFKNKFCKLVHHSKILCDILGDICQDFSFFVLFFCYFYARKYGIVYVEFVRH